MKKPLYGKILISRAFDTRVKAEEFAKDMKTEYRESEISLRYDIERTQDGQWKSTVSVKV